MTTTQIRTVVTFESSLFNTSEPRGYFINPCCYGDDVAHWLVRELRAKGYEAGHDLDQEDFGWYFTFTLSGVEYRFVIGHLPKENGADKEEVGLWFGALERSGGLIATILSGRKHEIQTAPLPIIHQILSSTSQIWNVRWHFERDFHKGRQDLGTPEPTTL